MAVRGDAGTLPVMRGSLPWPLDANGFENGPPAKRMESALHPAASPPIIAMTAKRDSVRTRSTLRRITLPTLTQNHRGHLSEVRVKHPLPPARFTYLRGRNLFTARTRRPRQGVRCGGRLRAPGGASRPAD